MKYYISKRIIMQLVLLFYKTPDLFKIASLILY